MKSRDKVNFFEILCDTFGKALVLFCAVFGILSVGLFCLNEGVLYPKIFAPTVLLCVVYIVILYFVSSKTKKDLIAIALLTTGSLAVMLGWNFICPAENISDYGVILEGAESIIKGTFGAEAADKTNYFYFYNFQIPYTFFVSLLLRLTGGKAFLLRLTEIVIMTLTNVVLYKTLRLFFDISESFFGAFVFATFTFVFMGSGVTNNQHMALLLISLAAYFYLKLDGYKKYIIAGIIVSFGELVRSSTIVIWLSLVFVALIKGIAEKDKKRFIGAAILVALHFGITVGAGELLKLSSIAPYGISISNPYFKLMLGLTGKGLTGIETTDARHTELFYDLQHFGFDYEAYKDASKKALTEKLVNGEIEPRFIFEKMVKFMGAFDNQYRYANRAFAENNAVLVTIMNTFGELMYALSLLVFGIYAVLKKPMKDERFLLCGVIFAAYFAVHILIEIQTRYRYEMYYTLMIMSAPIIYRAVNKLLKRNRKKG